MKGLCCANILACCFLLSCSSVTTQSGHTPIAHVDDNSPARSSKSSSIRNYEHMAFSRIGSTWDNLVEKNRSNLVPGTVRVSFVVNASGHADQLKLRSNSGNNLLGKIALASVQSTRLPSLPSDVAGKLPHHRLDMDCSFHIVHGE